MTRPILRSFPAAATALTLLSLTAWAAPPLSGAIFTTTVDGDIVNENVRYDAKEDVYLDGGPGPNAPSSAAGLPAGDYYFQVTDPSGKDLLSTDHISCRKVRVNGYGVIDKVYSGTTYEKVKGSWTAVSCKHDEGVELDYGGAPENAITVQLYPYDDTPNPGGVYKVWITPVDDYTGDTSGCTVGDKGPCNINGEGWSGGNAHGFVPAASKTDNYKVRYKGKPYDAPEIDLDKFHDADADGVHDSGEEYISGWAVTVEDPLGIENTEYTPAVIVADPAGTWTFTESTPAPSLQTVAIVDGTTVESYPGASPTVTVSVAGTSGETHDVLYGNVGTLIFDPCKIYDADRSGTLTDGDVYVEGWEFTLTGTDVLGNSVNDTVYTDASGCVDFTPNLLPGSYTISEGTELSGDWYSTTGETSVSFTVRSVLVGGVPTGTAYDSDGNVITGFDFFNYAVEDVDFDTKGYWHNKNGLGEITTGDVSAANALDPYSSASSYFDAGDEPFDGTYSDGTDVDAAKNFDGDTVAGAGTALAEISAFLIDSNAGGDPREQLAQQLLAFFFNTRHRTSGDAIQADDGTWYSEADLIDEAIDAWNSGTDAERTAIASLLDAFNNDDSVQTIPSTPPTPTF